jgi:hypothetical protein
MVSSNSALAIALREFFVNYDVQDVPYLLWGFLREWIVPIAVGLVVVGGSAKGMATLQRYMFPPSHRTRHHDALSMYSKGKVTDALREWSTLQECYGPSCLSRACHAIYVQGQPQQGMQLLTDAQAKGILTGRNDKQTIESMTFDAQAILQGNAVMVDMNARFAKQEHLGVSSP